MAGRSWKSKSASAGMTIVEMIIAMAISSILVVATLSTTMGSMQSAQRSSQRLSAAGDLLLMSNFLSREAPNAGGFGIPVSGAIWVENSDKDNTCPGRPPGQAFSEPCLDNTDRLTTVKALSSKVCTVSDNSKFGKLTFAKNPAAVAPDVVCCLSHLVNPNNAQTWAQRLVSSQVLLVKGDLYGERLVTAADENACTLTLADPGVGDISINDNVVDDPSAPYAATWNGADVIPVEVSTFYLEQPQSQASGYQLVKYVYPNGNPKPTKQVLADRVFDFQVALCFDYDPADGYCRDTGDNADEFVYNYPGEKFYYSGPGRKLPFQNISTETLRMLAIGIVVGAPSGNSTQAQQAQILDGPARNIPHWNLESGVVKTGLRSTYTYQ